MNEVYFDTIFATPTDVQTWPAVFAIISAYATTGELWPDEVNRAADAELEKELRSRGFRLERITGSSPDGVHSEPSWAAEIALDEALEIASHFKQRAIYYVRHDLLTVVDVSSREAIDLGSFRSCLSTAM